ncbi:MAG: hypothetical protein NVSMB23_07890 [Myxococcales bacterium]
MGLARQMFTKAVALDPNSWTSWTALGTADAQLGELPDALLAAERAQKLRPTEPKVIALVSLVRGKLAAAGVTDEALRQYRLGSAAVAARQDRVAQDALRQAIAAAPRFADAHYNLAIVLRRSGDRGGAEQEYRAALASFGDAKSANRADAQNFLADLLVESPGKAREARALVTDAIAVRGPRASYLDTLARACDALHDTTCARDSFRKLLDSKDELPGFVRLHAEERLRALGK